jgi:ATP-dependent DNA helicase RecQ
VEDKLQNSSNFKKNPQSSIIYVRNRKACLEISSQLPSGFETTISGLNSKKKTKHAALDARQSTKLIRYKCFGIE